jgi:hypothetical protein
MNMGILKDFKVSFLVAFFALIAAYMWAGVNGLIATVILIVLEVSISFDNAVVNAKVLNGMSKKWQDAFLTWGMVIAVFGMRVLFPITIVAIASNISMYDVTKMALYDSDTYSILLHNAHYIISSFGGIFLLMVFLNFMLDQDREEQWIKPIEQFFSKIGKLDSFSIVIALVVLMVSANYVPSSEQFSVVSSGLIGMVSYIVLSSFSDFMEKSKSESSSSGNVAKSIISAGLMSFFYLEVLDASFSLDGVIGAFAITKDVVIIMIGLGVGALFVRSMTISLVRHGALSSFVYLEHGAHYAIGALAVIMMLSMFIHVTEVLTGLIGAVFIGAGLYSSILHNRAKNK